MDTINSLRQALSTSLNEFVQALTAYLPNILTALVLLLLGWLIASLISKLILRFGTGIDRLTANLRKQVKETPKPLRRPVTPIVARILYWLIIVFFVSSAVEPLGLPGLAEWINQFISYLPKILIAGLILLAGYALGGVTHDFVATKAQGRGSESATLLGLTAQGLIISFAAILAIAQLGLDITLLINIFTIAIAACLGGIGLAFGIGASHQVGNILASHHLQRVYRVGQTVRVSGIEGDILELTITAVILDAEEGRVLVPAKVFAENVSVLVNKEDTDG